MLLNFIIPSILMGLGIAIDVAVATVSRFQDTSMKFRNWTLPVAIFHITLPAFGYYGWWFMGTLFQELSLILGIIAFLMITAFIYEAFCDWISVKPLVSLSPITNWIFNKLGLESKGHLVIILAVSMDALWSGPAKAAQAESGQWSTLEVFVSFFIAGCIVAIVAELSLLIAQALNRNLFQDSEHLTSYLVVGKYLEATILFGFGLLSLWNAFSVWSDVGSLSVCILLSGLFMLVIWVIYWPNLKQVQLKELEEVR